MSLRFRIILSAACAALSLLAFWSYGSQVRSEADQVRQEAMERYGGEVVSLVVANRALEAGEQVGMADVSVVDWLVDLAPEGCLTSLDAVLGMSVTVPVAKGAPLTDLNFRTGSDAMEVPEGRIAISVPATDKTGVPREVRAGSVLAAYALGDNDVRLISADLVVLSTPGESAVARGDSSLSVAASPEEVATLLLASARGELRLVLPADDMGTPDGLVPAAPSEVPEEEAAAQDDAEPEDGTPVVPEKDDGTGAADGAQQEREAA